MAEILVLLAIAALLYGALLPLRHWIERRYLQRHGASLGRVIALRRRDDGSYAAPRSDTPRSDRPGEREDNDANKR